MSDPRALTNAQVSLFVSFSARQGLMPRRLSVAQRYADMIEMIDMIDAANIAYDFRDLMAVRRYLQHRMELAQACAF